MVSLAVWGALLFYGGLLRSVLGQQLYMEARVLVAVGGSADVEVVPSSFRVLVQMKCSPVAYDKKKDGDLPSCHSQLYFMQGKC